MEHKLVISGEDFLWWLSAHRDGLSIKMWIYVFEAEGKAYWSTVEMKTYSLSAAQTITEIFCDLLQSVICGFHLSRVMRKPGLSDCSWVSGPPAEPESQSHILVEFSLAPDVFHGFVRGFRWYLCYFQYFLCFFSWCLCVSQEPLNGF